MKESDNTSPDRPETPEETVVRLTKELESANTRLAEIENEHWHLSALVASAEDAIITKTLDGIVTSWNQAAERIFGYTAEEMMGQPISLLIPPEQVDEGPGILAALRQGKRVKHYETRRLRKDGRVIFVSLTVSPILDSADKVLGASKIVRDITDRVEANSRERKALEEARTARRQAELANRVRDEFLATVSHELRTPLTAVVGWVHLLRSGNLDKEKSEKAIQVIDRNIRVQTQLIEDLLDISRVTMGKLRLELRRVDPAVVINAAAESLRFAAEARQITVKTTLSTQVGSVRADAQRLQQVVSNLLSNAIKFSPRGSQVEIELMQRGSYIEITVTDHGKGVDPEFLPHIFDRFSQFETSTTRSHGGLGLGLAIAKAIMDLHGGTITAASSGEGKGATFKLTLPLMAMHDQPDSTQGVTRVGNRLPAGRREVSGMKVLVIDDDPDTCEMIRTCLEQNGANVRTASSAERGLEILETWQPAVLISDIGMPVMDGYEMIRRIRDAEKRKGVPMVPAVALTAFTRIEDRVRSLAAGYQMHVSKPVEPAELLAIVGNLAGLIEHEA